MSDADAFEGAILSEPSSDVPRLVYADWLDETGDPANAARAEYIRLQCEAATLSDLDHRRHMLEERAAAIFRDHWLNWWRPVCRRLDLPMPFVKRDTFLARLKRIVDTDLPVGWPYHAMAIRNGDLISRHRASGLPPLLRAMDTAKFARGFVDELNFGGKRYGQVRLGIADWLAAVPARGLRLVYSGGAGFAVDDSPALGGIRRLAVDVTGADDPAACLRSAHFAGLDELELSTHYAGLTAPELRSVADAPAGSRLRRLSVPVADVPAVAVLGDAERFASVLDLTVMLEEDSTDDRSADVTACVAHLNAGLRTRLERLSLFTHGDLPPAGFAELARHPWLFLRTLELLDPLVPDDLRALSADAFPHLEELFLVLEPSAADETLEELTKWPVLRGLKRLCFGGGTAKADPDRIVELVESAVDLDVLQTFHLEPHADATLKERLSAILGDRLWMG